MSGPQWQGVCPAAVTLARRLRAGEAPRLNTSELDAVLIWVAGGSGERTLWLSQMLGPAGSDAALLQRVYAQLDGLIFAEGRLHEARAGVSALNSEAARLARYRRLMAAFHPDRHPALARWLTPRSQAIHQAYAVFRAGGGGQTRKADLGARRPIRGSGRRPYRGGSRPVRFRPGLAALLRNRFAGVRYLQLKALALVALAALFTVLHLYLTQLPARTGMPPQTEPREVSGHADPKMLDPGVLGRDTTKGL